MDKRWYKVADILVSNTGVKKGEKVMIAMHETHTEDLVTAVCQKVIECGAYPQVQFLSERIRRRVMQGTNEQASRVPDMEMWSMEWADVYFGIRGGFNLHETFDISKEKLSLNQEANGKVSKARWQNTRWCLIKVPNSDMATEGSISYETLLDNFFDSCFINWQERGLDKLCEKMAGSHIRVVSKDTDISFSIEGRKWLSFDGRMNMPDGEIATAPVTDTIDGYISFKNPGVLGGNLFENMRLEWKKGILVSATCSNNKELLTKIVSTDKGSSLIGEFAFGLNEGLKHFCNDILLDEKILGTMHFALGRAYRECGGINDSSIHWDIVLDTREDSAVYLDGKKIFENGKFLI